MENYLIIGYINMGRITFIEQYCLVNGKPIKLKDYQKEFIKRLEQWSRFISETASGIK